MQPRSHAAVIRHAARHAGGEVSTQVEALLSGNDDEDVHIVPVVGWRLRAAGLSHSCHPGSRFGELWAPSARWQSERLFWRAVGTHRRDPRAAFVMLGRVCHLIGDAGVPARAQGVWHFDGDPFESWLEANAGCIDESDVRCVEPSVVAEIVDGLATIAAGEIADTTRTPWGWLRYRRGRGLVVNDALAEEQARRLVPAIVGHTARILALFETEVHRAA